ncbi:MAG: cobalamin biosynthesis protein, partial [Nitrososphaera sp.]
MLALLAALAAGVGVDWLFGDPPNRYHPVAWLGRLVGYCVPRLKGGAERAKGTAFAVLLVAAVGLAVHFLVFASMYLAGVVALAVASAII